MPEHRRFPRVASGAFRRRRNAQNLRMRVLGRGVRRGARPARVPGARGWGCELVRGVGGCRVTATPAKLNGMAEEGGVGIGVAGGSGGCERQCLSGFGWPRGVVGDCSCWGVKISQDLRSERLRRPVGAICGRAVHSQVRHRPLNHAETALPKPCRLTLAGVATAPAHPCHQLAVPPAGAGQDRRWLHGMCPGGGGPCRPRSRAPRAGPPRAGPPAALVARITQ